MTVKRISQYLRLSGSHPNSAGKDPARPKLKSETPCASLAGPCWWDSCEAWRRKVVANRLVEQAYAPGRSELG